MAVPFDPPAADLPGKFEIPGWVRPPTSKQDFDWAKLRSIDLSLLDCSDPTELQELVDTCRRATRDDGFIFLENYGISHKQLHRQFSIANYLHRNISDEDKKRLHWNPDESGTFAGWKPRFGWRRDAGATDNIEHMNYYQPEFESMDKGSYLHTPEFWDEIVAFCNYLTYSFITQAVVQGLGT